MSASNSNLVSITSGRKGRRGVYSTFEINGYVADIIVDSKTDPPIYHWIIQRSGSADVLFWGQEHTFDEAEAAAYSCIDTLLRRRKIA